MSKKAGFTLVELLIAISLVGMIILSITAIDVASRRFINTANYAAQVQSEVGPVLERMAKDISQAYGYYNNTGINLTGTTQITIRQIDTAPHTYTIFTDDPGIRYTYNPGPAFNITREERTCLSCPWTPAPPETIARNINACSFIAEPLSPLPRERVNVFLTARRNAASPVALDNPEVILDTSVSSSSNPIN